MQGNVRDIVRGVSHDTHARTHARTHACRHARTQEALVMLASEAPAACKLPPIGSLDAAVRLALPTWHRPLTHYMECRFSPPQQPSETHRGTLFPFDHFPRPGPISLCTLLASTNEGQKLFALFLSMYPVIFFSSFLAFAHSLSLLPAAVLTGAIVSRTQYRQ